MVGDSGVNILCSHLVITPVNRLIDANHGKPSPDVVSPGWGTVQRMELQLNNRVPTSGVTDGKKSAQRIGSPLTSGSRACL